MEYLYVRTEGGQIKAYFVNNEKEIEYYYDDYESVVSHLKDILENTIPVSYGVYEENGREFIGQIDFANFNIMIGSNILLNKNMLFVKEALTRSFPEEKLNNVLRLNAVDPVYRSNDEELNQIINEELSKSEIRQKNYKEKIKNRTCKIIAATSVLTFIITGSALYKLKKDHQKYLDDLTTTGMNVETTIPATSTTVCETEITFNIVNYEDEFSQKIADFLVSEKGQRFVEVCIEVGCDLSEALSVAYYSSNGNLETMDDIFNANSSIYLGEVMTYTNPGGEEVSVVINPSDDYDTSVFNGILIFSTVYDNNRTGFYPLDAYYYGDQAYNFLLNCSLFALGMDDFAKIEDELVKFQNFYCEFRELFCENPTNFLAYLSQNYPNAYSMLLEKCPEEAGYYDNYYGNAGDPNYTGTIYSCDKTIQEVVDEVVVMPGNSIVR